MNGRGTRGARALVGAVLLTCGGWSLATADTEQAERQYRTARRLAAEGSAAAREALAEVIRLDPTGPLTDDALVEQARLEPLAEWPEAAGRIDVISARRALEALDRTIADFPEGDRTPEARYLRGLIRLEPLATYDETAARVDLAAVATGVSAWSRKARYAMAWLDEQLGRADHARDTYQRLLVDGPTDDEGRRARLGLARVLLRDGDFGQAARWLQEAIELGVTDDGSRLQRELAVRAVLREAGAADASRPTRARSGVRGLSGFAPTASGGVLLGDRKQDLVVELAAGGERVGQWTVEGIQTVAVDRRGRRYAASKTDVLRLEEGGRTTPLAVLGDYAPLSDLVLDGLGGMWLLERRGRRIGRIEPGQTTPRAFWEAGDRRLESLAWDGRRLLAIDTRNREVVALVGGVVTTLVPRETMRPVALAVDRTGRIAVIDTRTDTIRFVGFDGREEATSFSSPDVPRPTALGLGPEGELQLFDGDGDWIAYR